MRILNLAVKYRIILSDLWCLRMLRRIWLRSLMNNRRLNRLSWVGAISYSWLLSILNFVSRMWARGILLRWMNWDLWLLSMCCRLRRVAVVCTRSWKSRIAWCWILEIRKPRIRLVLKNRRCSGRSCPRRVGLVVVLLRLSWWLYF